VKIPYIGMLNIVAGREVAREFVQGAFEPMRVVEALTPLFDPRSTERLAMLAGLAEVRARLGEPGAAARVAAMASELAR
jgi:lipid-A-disaccharide synthase